MPWIKKNPHLLTLLILAVLVIGGSTLVALRAKSFDETFNPARVNPPQRSEIAPLQMGVIDDAKTELTKPKTWTTNVIDKPVFVPVLYSVTNNALERFGVGSHRKDPLTGRDIEDVWFLNNGIQITDPTIASQDSDGDGFTNADEWRAEPKTNPRDEKSHPPYTSKLYFKQYIKVRFLLKFNSYDGDPTKPQELIFGINSREFPRAPTQFLKLGDNVFGNKFKIIKFEYKNIVDPNGIEKDVSELTLQNNNTGDTLILVHRLEVDSPDSYALFSYYWSRPVKGMKDATDIRVPKKGKFSFPPEPDNAYQLLDITENSASIKRLATQDSPEEIVQVPPIPAALK